MECDLTTELANYGKSCEGRAAKAEQEAERLEDKSLTMGAPGMQERRTRDAQEKRLEAVLWRQRATVAAEGFMLVDTSDSKFMLENGVIIGKAAKAHRTRFVQSLGHGGMERAGLTPQQK